MKTLKEELEDRIDDEIETLKTLANNGKIKSFKTTGDRGFLGI